LNIARYLQIDPETALNGANRKFSKRFREMEKHFTSEGRALKEVPLEEMEAFWQESKQSQSGT
jgi:ATP diphosphatase